MKTILITVSHGAVAKNILRTDVIKVLLAEPDIRVVVIMKFRDRAVLYAEEIPHERIVYDFFYRSPTGVFERLFAFLKFRLISTVSTDLWRKMAYDHAGNRFFYIASIFFSRVFARSGVRRIVRFLDQNLVGDSGFGTILEKYRPDLVVLTHLFGDAETAFLRESRRRGIRIVGYINSWDKLTGRCALRLLPDKMIVFNDIVKDEAVKYADMPEKDIIVCGIPQYDQYADRRFVPREEFFKILGLDPKKRLVLYSPRGITCAESDFAVIDLLHAAFSSGMVKNADLFVRFPPNDFLDKGELAKRPWLKYELPGRRFFSKQDRMVHGVLRSDDWDMGFSELEHLRNLLAHVSLVVGYTSSIMIDAAFFDKPIIGVYFEIKQGLPLMEQPTQYYQTEHFMKALKSGGIRLARTREELVGAMNAYFENPSLDRGGRKRLAEEQCWRLDGRSGERVAKAIINLLSH